MFSLFLLLSSNLGSGIVFSTKFKGRGVTLYVPFGARNCVLLCTLYLVCGGGALLARACCFMFLVVVVFVLGACPIIYIISVPLCFVFLVL